MKTIISEITDRESFFRGTDTMSVGYPWLAFGAILTLESIVNKNMNVLEFGGGGSTLWFAKNCNSVETIETDPKWVEFIIKRLRELKLDNAEIWVSSGEEDSLKILNSDPKDYYDIILVDSGWLYDKEGKHSPNRRRLFEAAIPHLKKGGYMIIDNYQHYGMKHFDYKGFEVYTYDDINYSGRGTKICQKL